MTIKSLFRYSGNKGRMLKYIKDIPVGIERVVEPYLGSGAFIINNDKSGLGIELNTDLCEMWWWLQSVTEDELQYLSSLVDSFKADKTDIREFGLEIGPQTYVKVNCCSAMVGQLSSWKLYPQHNLPIKKTIDCLDDLARITIINDTASSYVSTDGDLLFVDPPYIDTSGNYGVDGYHPNDTIDLVNNTDNPVIFTYGSNALEIFPNYDWEILCVRKVPNLRAGGTTDRVEYVTYLNWRE